MGQQEGWAQPSGLLPNGLLPEEVAGVTRVLDVERWTMAERRTAELIARIQPDQPSEKRRRDVANYVERLIMKCFSCKVFTFGSVPLKTYLPDGDIDLTACSSTEDLKDLWANEVRDALESEEKNENAEFRVKEVQYIQAEVKIIKCLVENIVVDISFNQVGGLCTLCFLEEVDHLINQNHLFKRSIILIKAWCYYESRILGAHHGLISTYALETLVLYIFHVFNNSFAGPLEVLYRFLEFFSNFDWENFCLSLWGPVPISSLPDMTAEPPRRDGGDLLLSKMFLDGCSSVYAVMPGGQEKQGQPFVRKHFNVIDPLRTNNNLGRSVSKGNFFRIRSAFAFGAKKLARLLECPKADMIAEVNQFFMNTLERHGSGNRPDAPSPNLRQLRPSENVPAEETKKYRSTASIKKKNENIALPVDHENQAESGHDYHDLTSQALNKISQNSRNLNKTSSPSVSHTQSQKTYGMQTYSRVSDQFERTTSPSGSVQSERDQKASKPNYSVNDQNGHRFQFARTRSSPELTDSSVKVLPLGWRNRAVEAMNSAMFEYSSRRNNLASDVASSHSTKSSLDDPASYMNNSPRPSLEAASDTNGASNSYRDDISFTTTSEELASVSEALQMQQEMNQEEQDMINLMASAKVHNFDGQVPVPMHMTSPHLPMTLSPLLASTVHGQRNLTGIISANLSFLGPPWAPHMQLPQGFISPSMSDYFHAPAFSSKPGERTEPVHESSAAAELNQEDSNSWKEHGTALTRGFNSEKRDSQMLHFDNKQRSSSGGFNFISASQSSNPGALLRGHPKFAREDTGPVREDYAGIHQNQTSRGPSVNHNIRNSSLRHIPVMQATSSRSKPLYESSKDGSTGKMLRSAKEKWGKKPVASAAQTLHGKSKTGLHTENITEQFSTQVEDVTRDWVPIPMVGNDASDKISGSVYSRSQEVHGNEQAHGRGSDPMVIVSSRQRAMDNSGVLPVTFVPTGPPVPFVMVPLNFTSVIGNADSSAAQFDRNEETDSCSVNPRGQIFGSLENHDQTEHRITSTSLITSVPESEEHKSDILTGDFASHWENLLYGRYCQNTHIPGPLMVPPMYLQSHFPWDSSGRPLSPNVNMTQMMGYGPRLVPLMLQPGPDRASGVFQHYGEDAPRYRGGTGTYLPNPKVSFRDRQSNIRNHRGSYYSDKTDHGSREGSWINSKSRAARNHGRGQAERPSSRSDRPTAAENQADRQWQTYRNDSFRHEPVASYTAQNSSLGPRSSTGAGNMTYGMYQVPAMTSNSMNPAAPAMSPMVMVYQYDQGAGYGSSGEPLEFGSLGPVHLSGANDVPKPGDEQSLSSVYEHRHGIFRGSSSRSSRSSPDQPSSPHLRR
ncbi:uncharacterized protein [Typha angustifolia]|uniref:uncharacterized protein isoform X1 n=2 Tax=Typha angustifolia TaxID=59011 RepID=UPI003C2EFC2B